MCSSDLYRCADAAVRCLNMQHRTNGGGNIRHIVRLGTLMLEEPPESLDVLVVVCDIRMIEINEVTHLLGQLAPLSGELHHVLAALVVVILGRDILLRSLVVDILLGDAEFLLDTEFNRESVPIV